MIRGNSVLSVGSEEIQWNKMYSKLADYQCVGRVYV